MGLSTRTVLSSSLAAVLLSAVLVLASGPAGASLVDGQAECNANEIVPSSWAPQEPDMDSSGEWVAFTSTADPTGDNADGSRELFLWDGTDEGVVQITEHASGDASMPRVSDGGLWVAYVLDDDGTATPHLVQVTGLTDVAIGSSTAAGIFGIDISGDGSTVVFDSTEAGGGTNPDGNREVWAYDVDADTLSPLTVQAPGTASYDPAVDQDGDRVAFSSDGDLAVPPANTDGSVEVYVDDAGEVAPFQVSDAAVASSVIYDAEISDEGDRVSFTAGAAAEYDTGAGSTIWAVEVEGDGMTQISPTPPKDEVYDDGRMSGDGDHVFFPSERVATDDGFSAGIAPAYADLVPDDTGLHLAALGGGGLDYVWCTTFLDAGLSHPFLEEIEWVAGAGISEGYADGGFHPAAPVSRQAMAAFLYRASGSPPFEPPGEATFDDVPLDHPFFAEVEWVSFEEIAEGYEDGGFHPAAPVSRQAMAAFLYREAGEPAFSPPAEPTFSDVAVDHPFFAEIEWVADEEIAEGYADGGFHPAAPVSRQAMAAFLYRAVP